jgi:hypothetical protein
MNYAPKTPRRMGWWCGAALSVLASLVVVGCSGGETSVATPVTTGVAPTQSGVAITAPTAVVGETRTIIPAQTPDLSHTATVLSATPTQPVGNVLIIDDVTANEARERFERVLRAPWATDFTRSTISFDEIMTGGPAKDGIPAIDQPRFESIAEADVWLDDLEPVQVVDIGGDSRAYPVQIMVWHELVNDVVGGEPVVVTF